MGGVIIRRIVASTAIDRVCPFQVVKALHGHCDPLPAMLKASETRPYFPCIRAFPGLMIRSIAAKIAIFEKIVNFFLPFF